MDELGQARAWHHRGALDQAIPSYERALKSHPADASAWHDYGIALLQAGKPSEAVAVLERGLSFSPNHFDLLLALSQARQRNGQLDEAKACAQAATDALPGNALGWLLRGRLESITGADALAEASLRRALAIAPTLDEAWHYLGESLQRQGQWSAAEAAYRRAALAHPGEIMNVGICAERAGRWEEAREAYRRMCELYPLRRDCLGRLAQVAAMLCDFETESHATTQLGALLTAPASRTTTPPSDDYAEPFALSYLPIPGDARRFATKQYAQRIIRRAPAPLPPPAPSNGTRIRIGYLGADFGRHAVGTLLQGLFSAHDRSRYEVFGYSLRRHDDALGRALRVEFDVFRDVEGEALRDIASRIREDRIDVLVDLGGYTQGSRPEVLAMRPAPLQLGWLGFIHGHDALWLDGLIMDEHVQPLDADWPYSDKVHRIAGLMFPCGPMPRGTPDRPRFGLPPDVPLLASFNNSYKLDHGLVDAWIRILQRVDHAHLAIYLPPQARNGFHRQWARQGGDASRLHVLDHLPMREQADRAASCDLFLDAFRYQAGATALACMGAGLPILSRDGDGPLSRLSAGMNRFLGLDDLVCSSTHDYVERAVALATDPGRLAALRERMTRAADERGLFNPRRAAAAIESLVDGLLPGDLRQTGAHHVHG